MGEAKNRPDAEETLEEEDKARKVGFHLSSETDFKLTVYARRLRVSRSSVVEKLLAKELSGVTVSFRNKARKVGEAA